MPTKMYRSYVSLPSDVEIIANEIARMKNLKLATLLSSELSMLFRKQAGELELFRQSQLIQEESNQDEIPVFGRESKLDSQQQIDSVSSRRASGGSK